MRKITFPRSFYIPKHATKVADKASDAVAYFAPFQHESGATRYHVVGFTGRADKPTINWTVRKFEGVERAIRELFERRRAHAEYIAKRKAETVAFQHSCKVGDIYRTCWGYDQTNVEFFEVVEIRGKHAILREIACASTSDGAGQDRVVPQSGAFLEPRYQGDDQGLPIRRLIQDGRIKIDNVRTAWPWGKRVAGVVIGEAAHRTAAGWGH